MSKISTFGSFDSAPSSVVSRDRSVTRSAQDDDFVGVLTKNIQTKLALMGAAPSNASPTRAKEEDGPVQDLSDMK